MYKLKLVCDDEVVSLLSAVFVSYFRLSLCGLFFLLDVVLHLLELQPEGLVSPPPPILQRLHQLLHPQHHPSAAPGALERGRSISINLHVQQRVSPECLCPLWCTRSHAPQRCHSSEYMKTKAAKLIQIPHFFQ